MKKLFTIKMIEHLLQIIIICFLAVFLLFILEGCQAEYLSEKKQKEAIESLHLSVINKAGDDDLKMVFVPEGYTADQMDLFRQEVGLAWDIIRQTKPYSYCLDKMNVYYTTELASVSDTIGSGHTTFGLEMPKPYHAHSRISTDSIMHVMEKVGFPVEKTILIILVNLGEGTSLGFTLLTNPSVQMTIPVTVVIQSLFCKDPAALSHELGHAIGLLGEEYYGNEENYIFNDSVRNEIQYWQDKGLFLNVSLSNDESEVFWHEFLADNAFPEENLGIYEGGECYPHGVYRSTSNSVMRFHFQSFYYNAVGRYLIYRRIENMHSGHDVSYEEWKLTDLAHTQVPIDMQALTGGITRSVEDASHNFYYNDVVILK